MSEKITKERWIDAQRAERLQHTMALDIGYDHYYRSYKNYFRYLGMEFEQHGKKIIEVGPADFPALGYCNGFKDSVVVEPMPSAHLQYIAAQCEFAVITIMTQPLEEIYFSEPHLFDECWLFNVMQHIIDPDLFIEKCKQSAKLIRFFEPINEGICVYHPHVYTREDFEKWFADSVNYYNDRREGFHQAECVYGTYICNGNDK